MFHIENISGNIAAKLCRKITAKLPEYFGLPDVNEHYAIGTQTRINLAAKTNNEHVGLISIDFPYQNNSNIYWMAILPNYHSQGIGRKLIMAAINIAKEQNAKTMTVETLAPFESDQNYIKTYNFYLKNNFSPLFNLKPQGYEWNMVYMVKTI